MSVWRSDVGSSDLTGSRPSHVDQAETGAGRVVRFSGLAHLLLVERLEPRLVPAAQMVDPLAQPIGIRGVDHVAAAYGVALIVMRDQYDRRLSDQVVGIAAGDGIAHVLRLLELDGKDDHQERKTTRMKHSH